VVRVWDAFYAIGPWVAVLVPAVVLVLAFVLLAVRPYVRTLVDVLLAGLTAVAVTLTLALTMAPAGDTGTRLAWNLNPLPTLRVIVTGEASRYGTQMDALGNLLLILPLGCFLALLAGSRVAVLLVVAVSLSLETTQWLMATGRQPEVADVLLNATGGLLGVGLAWIAARIVREPLPGRVEPA
jgi:glycopeptide antibiotics resistance protein